MRNTVYMLEERVISLLKSGEIAGGWSQDRGVGGCRVRVSPQLGCLPDTGGGHRHPRSWDEPLSEWVGHEREQGAGRRSGGWTGLAPLRGGWEKGGIPMPGGTLGGLEDQGKCG